MRDIRRRYGHEVADIVDACTDSYDDPPSSWLVRKQQYLEHLPESSPSALRASLADKVDNVRELLYELRSSDAGPKAAAGGRGASQDVSWYYASLARTFEILAPGSRADELSRLASSSPSARRRPLVSPRVARLEKDERGAVRRSPRGEGDRRRLSHGGRRRRVVGLWSCAPGEEPGAHDISLATVAPAIVNVRGTDGSSPTGRAA